jgi:hypothetical protein
MKEVVTSASAEEFQEQVPRNYLVGEMYRNEGGGGRCYLILGQEEVCVTDLAITVFCPLD